MTTPAPEFTPPAFDWDKIPAADAPAFGTPNPKPERPSFLGGRPKKAEERKAPPGTRKRTASKPRTVVPPSKPGQFTEDLMAIYGAVALGISLKDPVCGMAIAQSAEKCAEAWDKMAQDNDAVRRVLFAITKTTAIGAVVAAHAPIIMAVGAHHGFGFGPRVVADDNNAEENVA